MQGLRSVTEGTIVEDTNSTSANAGVLMAGALTPASAVVLLG